MTMVVMADSSAAGEFGKKRLAKLGPPLAAVHGEKEHQTAQRVDIDALDLLSPRFSEMTKPAFTSTARCVEKVLWVRSLATTNCPVDSPSGSCWTSRRKVARRVDARGPIESKALC